MEINISRSLRRTESRFQELGSSTSSPPTILPPQPQPNPWALETPWLHRTFRPLALIAGVSRALMLEHPPQEGAAGSAQWDTLLPAVPELWFVASGQGGIWPPDCDPRGHLTRLILNESETCQVWFRTEHTPGVHVPTRHTMPVYSQPVRALRELCSWQGHARAARVNMGPLEPVSQPRAGAGSQSCCGPGSRSHQG